MKLFESFVYEENEVAAHNQKVLRERPLLIGYLLMATGFLLAFLLDLLSIGIFLIIVGTILQLLARFSVFTPKMRTGRITKTLKITKDFMQIDDTIFEFSKVQSVRIQMNFHKGQIETNTTQNWKSDGTNNEIILRNNNKELKFKYLLPSYHHVAAIRNMDFPDNVSIDDSIFF